MPTYVTREVFACGHAIQRQDRSVGSDAACLIAETLVLDVRCGGCLARELQRIPLIGGMPCIPRSRVRELQRYIFLWENRGIRGRLEWAKACLQGSLGSERYRAGLQELAMLPIYADYYLVYPGRA